MHTGVLLGDLKEQGYMKKTRRKWNNNSNNTLYRKIYSESYGLINPSQGSNKRQAGWCDYGDEPSGSNNCSSLETISFSRRTLLDAVCCSASCEPNAFQQPQFLRLVMYVV